MTATIALLATALFVAATLYRFIPAAPAAIARLALLLALIGGAFALIHWREIDDSRWLVAGLLAFAALALSAIRPRLRIAALILGILGLALMSVATVSPRAISPSAVQAGS